MQFQITCMLPHVHFHWWCRGKQSFTFGTRSSFHTTQMSNQMIFKWWLGGECFVTTEFLTLVRFVTGMRSFVSFKIGILFKHFLAELTFCLWLLCLNFQKTLQFKNSYQYGTFIAYHINVHVHNISRNIRQV